MLIPNHPDDERLSALASRETDATGDATLTAHVTSCDRCTGLVNELGSLRAALSDLPDVAPSRPLRLLPPVEDAPSPAADRLGGWARRFFAPILASGAALALVGTIGTAAPSLSGQSATGGDAAGGAAEEGAAEPAASAFTGVTTEDAASSARAPQGAESVESADPATPLYSDSGTALQAAPEASADATTFGVDTDAPASTERLAAERSPWPMVLLAGVALMIAALLMRWILVPRAG
jgi:hypothetical protein